MGRSAGPRRLQGQREAQQGQNSKDIKDIHRIKAPLFQPAVERRGAEQLPPPAGGFPDDDLQSHHAALQPVGQSQRQGQPGPADAQGHTAQRTGQELASHRAGAELCGIKVPEQKGHQGFSRKLKADMFIDDRNLGGLPDWGVIYEMIKEKKTFADIYSQNGEEEKTSLKKKKRWLPF